MNQGSSSGALSNLDTSVLKILDLIPEYNGDKKTLSHFIKSTDEILEIVNQSNPSEITKSLTLITIKKKVTGKASEYLTTCPTIKKWKDLKDFLVSQYQDKRNECTLMIELCQLQQTKGTIFEFLRKYNDLFLLYINNIENKYSPLSIPDFKKFGHRFATQCFIRNCKEPFKSQLAARNPSSLVEINTLITNDFQHYEINTNQHNSNTTNTQYRQHMSP